MEINMNFDINSYRKAIIKIIYEMAYYWLGKGFLNDEMGAKIRDYVLSDKLDVAGLFGKVDLIGDKKDGLSFLADADSHTAILKREGNNIFCYVNLFNTFEGVLIVTNQVDNYHCNEGRFLVIDVPKNEMRESSLIEEIIKRSH
jgi:hypothetical protein